VQCYICAVCTVYMHKHLLVYCSFTDMVCFHSIAGRTCINDVDNVQQVGNSPIFPDKTVIVPRLKFTCNGRIANIRVGINDITAGTNFPYIQVWRQLSASQNYILVDGVQIQSNHLNTRLTYLEAIISLTGDNRIQFLSGDVIGFYNPPDSGYIIRDVATTGYAYHVFPGSIASSFDFNNFSFTNNGQPLIQFTLGKYGDSHYYTLMICDQI